MFKKALATLVLLITSVTVSAADNPLSVHVLNTQNGLPGPGIEVTLAYYDNGQWVSLNAGKTNEQGRITALYPAGKKIKEGVYKVTFKTGDWMKRRNAETFSLKSRLSLKLMERFHTTTSPCCSARLATQPTGATSDDTAKPPGRRNVLSG